MVETALVAIIFFMFLFGVFEYCRLIFLEQMMQQAAREGARYCVVNTTDSTVVADTQTVVKNMMVGLDKNYTYSCNVYKADDTGKNVGNATDAVSFCDALQAPMPGEITFAINSRTLAGGIAVSDPEVEVAMAVAYARLKLVIEPGGAVALAAVLAGRIAASGRTLVVVASGGNVDARLYAEVLARNKQHTTIQP